jgi:hypothetical protein
MPVVEGCRKKKTANKTEKREKEKIAISNGGAARSADPISISSEKCARKAGTFLTANANCPHRGPIANFRVFSRLSRLNNGEDV